MRAWGEQAGSRSAQAPSHPPSWPAEQTLGPQMVGHPPSLLLFWSKRRNAGAKSDKRHVSFGSDGNVPEPDGGGRTTCEGTK